jgi:hypothetical protein
VFYLESNRITSTHVKGKWNAMADVRISLYRLSLGSPCCLFDDQDAGRVSAD